MGRRGRRKKKDGGDEIDSMDSPVIGPSCPSYQGGYVPGEMLLPTASPVRPGPPALSLWDDSHVWTTGPELTGVPASSCGAPVRHPMTPLGLPNTPPALPGLPSFVLPDIDVESAPVEHAAGAEGGGDWTPVEVQQSRTADRRTFFHTNGKSYTFGGMSNPRPVIKVSDGYELGQAIRLKVEDIHFGNARIKIMQSDPAPMPQMLKWPPEKFDDHAIDCAQISFGESFKVWCAVGVRSNRLLYAMKRGNIARVNAVVTAPPETSGDAEDDIDLTYGASIQGIQLIP